jgi:hypothetical protein
MRLLHTSLPWLLRWTVCVCVCVCVCVRVCHKQMVVLLKNMFNNGACKTPKV